VSIAAAFALRYARVVSSSRAVVFLRSRRNTRQPVHWRTHHDCRRTQEAHDERTQAARYESLIRLAGAIRSRTGDDDLFGLLVDELRRTVAFDAIAQFDDTSAQINWCNECASGELYPIADETASVASWVHENQLSLVIPDVEDETRFRPSMQRLQIVGLRSVCAFPLSTARRQFGSIVIASRLASAYGPEDVRFLSLAAAQIALAMDAARNFRESQRAEERLRLLLDLTNRIVSNLDLRALLREVSASIRHVMHCEGAAVSRRLPRPANCGWSRSTFPAVRASSARGARPGISPTASPACSRQAVQPRSPSAPPSPKPSPSRAAVRVGSMS
jgi:transcriptional regulator with GAF, ATPase, and Fis domain